MRRDDGDGEEETTHPLSVSATNGNGIMKVCLSCVYMHASVRACVAACVHACALIHVCLYCSLAFVAHLVIIALTPSPSQMVTGKG